MRVRARARERESESKDERNSVDRRSRNIKRNKRVEKGGGGKEIKIIVALVQGAVGNAPCENDQKEKKGGGKKKERNK